jgi:hypothetical protein
VSPLRDRIDRRGKSVSGERGLDFEFVVDEGVATDVDHDSL